MRLLGGQTSLAHGNLFCDEISNKVLGAKVRWDTWSAVRNLAAQDT